MTPKDKAKQLVNRFYIPLMKNNYPNVAQMDTAKECALIAISFAKSSLDWHLYPLDKEWADLNQIEEEIKNL